MEKKYCHIRCPDCKIKIRLTITEKNYGMRVEIICPDCGRKCHTTIHAPTEPAQKSSKEILDELQQDNPFLDELNNLFGTRKKK